MAPRHACLACNHAAVASSKSGFSTCRAVPAPGDDPAAAAHLGHEHPQTSSSTRCACRRSQFERAGPLVPAVDDRRLGLLALNLRSGAGASLFYVRDLGAGALLRRFGGGGASSSFALWWRAPPTAPLASSPSSMATGRPRGFPSAPDTPKACAARARNPEQSARRNNRSSRAPPCAGAPALAAHRPSPSLRAGGASCTGVSTERRPAFPLSTPLRRSATHAYCNRTEAPPTQYFFERVDVVITTRGARRRASSPPSFRLGSFIYESTSRLKPALDQPSTTSADAPQASTQALTISDMLRCR